ncbi:MFS transporter [Saccharibacillus sp. CPCC 101409]|uniref:MFS transporter n=1 Tax=Saccharibacillus sp. CPCC 101409 TaxID=3058041 RepID=UPI002671DB18|nr:MFS transporter [Saccharibacillus sp. CPCC 101409]MDO3411698.1 MFS transporter [Saccharibacillus sp. CPCC 101409]
MDDIQTLHGSVPRSKQRTKAKNLGMTELLKQKSFMRLLLSRILSNFGDAVDAIAYSWLVYMLTGSKLMMGTLFAVGMLPNILLGPFAGVLVDRWSNKKVTVFSALLRGSLVFLTGLMVFTQHIEVWHLFALSILLSSISAFANPAMMSWVTHTLPKDLLLQGNSLSASISQSARLGGYALTGGLIAWAGIGGAFWVNALMLALSALVLFGTRGPDVSAASAAGEEDGFMQQFRSGAAYLFAEKKLLLIVLLVAFINFVAAPVEVLEAAYVAELLHQGPAALSALSISLAAGMIAAGLALGGIGAKFSKGLLIISGFILHGVSLALLLLPPALPDSNTALVFASALYFLMGFSVNLIASPMTSYLMENTPSSMLGRIGSLFNTICLSAYPLGSILVGSAAEHFELGGIYIALGAMTLLPGAILLANRTFRSLK